MLCKLTSIGNYSKTTAFTGTDHVRLHLPPKCVEDELASTFKKLIASLQDESETHRSNSGTQFHPAHKFLATSPTTADDAISLDPVYSNCGSEDDHHSSMWTGRKIHPNNPTFN